ncbi:MAG: DegT/DnrJ/EryC1/StrS family aminotransferase [Alphaproteobacteria bacterium]
MTARSALHSVPGSQWVDDRADAATIPFHQPDITDREVESVVEVLRSGWLTTGEKAAAFESAFAARVGAAHGVALSSCSAALHLALDAVGVGPGDEVIVPAMTFAATAAAAVHCGARPVLADICADDHTVDPAAVERLCGPRTKAIVTVGFGGQAARMEPILALARGRGIAVVDDAAHAFPARYRGRMVGSLADVTCFSFYATKTISAGEGGMATTDREDYARRIRLMGSHGITRNAHARNGDANGWAYEVLEPGWKYNMPDLLAALGLAQLARADAMWRRRRSIAMRYAAALAGCDAIEPILPRAECEHAWHLFVARICPERLALGRDGFIEALHARGVQCSVHFIPLHLQPWYRDRMTGGSDPCPVATERYRRSLSLPLYSSLRDDQVERVIEAVLDVARRWRR